MKKIILFMLLGYNIFAQSTNQSILMNYTWRLNSVQNGNETPVITENNVNYLLTFLNTTPYQYMLNICNTHTLTYTINNENNFNKIFKTSTLIICQNNPNNPNVVFFDNFAASFYNNDTTNIVPFQLIQIGNTYTLDIIYDNKIMKFHVHQLNQENFNLNQLNIYPNPTTEKIFINGFKEKVNVSIFNVNGQKVLENIEFVNEIDVSDLTNGMYLLKINNEEGKEITRKFMKN